MKRLVKPYIYLLSCYLLLFLSAACSSDAPFSQSGEEGGGVVRFRMDFAASTRVVVNPNTFKCAWEAGDAIGIYVVRRKSYETKALSSTPGENYKNNIKVTLQAGGTWAYDAGEDPIIYPNDGDVLDIYAYYPYDAAITDPNAISFAALEQESKMSAGMLMRAKTTVYTHDEASEVTLRFSHLMAMVQITCHEALTSCIAKDLNTAVTFNLNDGTAIPVSDQVKKDIRMMQRETNVWQMVVPPGQNTSRFSLENSGTGETYTVSAAKTLTQGTVTTLKVFPGFISIGSKEELKKIGVDPGYPLSGKYVQTAAIDLAGEEWEPSQTDFTGEYDGNGYVIDHLTVTSGNKSFRCLGLFARSTNGKFSNITLTNVSLKYADYLQYGGALIGWADGCEITNCRVIDAEIEGVDNLGGLVGMASNTTIMACCVNTCRITTYITSTGFAGGFIGWEISTCPITQSYCVGLTLAGGGGEFGTLGTFIGYTATPSGATPAECYSDVAGDSQSTTFSDTAWPSWTLYSAGGYWKSLGGWNGGTPVYPSLWYE
jgi:hypothetical protein